MSKLISSYEVDGSRIKIRTPYCQAVVDQCRKWAGKWENGAWSVPITRLDEVQKQLGINLADLVEVSVGKDDREGYQQLHVGWHVLAGRSSRDSRCDVYAELVDGEIPSSGGSMKNPAVQAPDAVFQLWVPRDFATVRGLKIVTDPTPIIYDKKFGCEKEDAMTIAKAMDVGRAFDQIVVGSEGGYEIVNAKEAEKR